MFTRKRNILMRTAGLILLFFMMSSVHLHAQVQTVTSTPPLTLNYTCINNPTTGSTLNLHARDNALNIVSFTPAEITAGATDYEIYYNTDSINGSPTITQANGWVLHETGPISSGAFVEIELDEPLFLPAGETYGIMVRAVGGMLRSSTTRTPCIFMDDNLRMNVCNLVSYWCGSWPNLTLQAPYVGRVSYEVAVWGLDVASERIDTPETYNPGWQDLGVVIVSNTEEQGILSANVGYQFDSEPPVEYVDFQLADTLRPQEEQRIMFTGNDGLYIPARGSYNLTIWASNPNGVYPDSNPSNDTLHLDICTADEGTWVIDRAGTGDFTSFTQAFEYFAHCGLSDDVVFEVMPGSYEENIRVPHLPGIGPNATLTIEGMGNSPEDVRLYGEDGADREALQFEGSSYITIRNMTIENESDGPGEEALAFDGTHNITIENVHFMRESTDVNNRYVFRASGTHNVTIHNSRFIGGGGSIYISGTGDDPHNVEIIGNELNDPGYRGMTLLNLENTTIHHNNINLHPGEHEQAIALFLSGSEQTDITRNAFANNGATAIHIQGENSGAASRSLIANNMIEAGFRSSPVTGGGIYAHQSSNIDIYHNSVHQDRSGGNIFRITSSGSPEGFDIRNNIFFYSGGGNGRAVIEDAGAIDDLDYNIYYSTGSSLYDFDGTTYNNWALYQSSEAYDQNSYFINPAFNGARDLRIANSNQIRTGTALGISSDFFDAQRDATEPVIGAHEVVLYDLAVLDIYRPNAGIECGLSEQPVYAIIQNWALEPLTGFELNVGISGDFTDNFTHTYEDVLPSYSDRDTVRLGTFDAREGGVVDIEVTHNLPDDANPNNDEASVSREFDAAPFEPTVTDITVCGATDPVTLTASSNDGEIFWFTSSEGGFQVEVGEEYETTHLLGTSTFYLEVEHDVTGCISDFRTPISVISNRLPQVDFTQGNIFDGVLQSGTQSNPDVAFYGGTNEYELLPMFGLQNDAYGSGWEISSWSLEAAGNPANSASLTTPSGNNNGQLQFTPAQNEVDETFRLHLELVNHDTGCEGEVERYISVVDGPVALFNAESDVCHGTIVVFENQSTIASGQLVDFEWSMGDGSIINRADTSRVEHHYDQPGTYDVTLRTWSQDGTEGNVTHQVTVHPQPEAMFTAADMVCAGIDVEFENNSEVHGQNVTYTWNFGDSETSTDENPVHQYASGSQYVVSLIAETDNGCTDQYQETIDIFTLPEPAIVANDEVCAGEEMMFSSEIRSSSNTYSWLIEDGIETEGMDIEHVFNESGQQTVIHTVTTPHGCEGSIEHEVMVHAVPSSEFSIITEGLEWTFMPAEEGLPAYHWDFGDQNSSIEESPAHVYESNGYYNVVLTTESEEGCVSSTTSIVEIMNTSLTEVPEGIGYNAYPNPFGEEGMQVELNLETGDHVQIVMQDMLGRTVTTVANEWLAAGEHIFSIDGSADQLSSGVYLLKIRAGEETFRHKILYQR